MKRIFTGLVLAFLAAFAGQVAHAQSPSKLQGILNNGVLRVGTTGDFNPMTTRDVASGSYAGFEIDAANRLGEDLGVKVEFVPTDWKTMVAGVVADKYDIVMSGTSLDMGRAKAVGYTNPYVFVGTVPLATSANADKFKSWEDVDKPEVTVAVILGTVFEAQARAHFPNAKIVTVEAPATGYQEVLSGRADVTITSNLDAAALTERFDQLTTFATGEMRNKRPLGYITPQGDFALINLINTWIELRKADGFFDGLAAKWKL